MKNCKTQDKPVAVPCSLTANTLECDVDHGYKYIYSLVHFLWFTWFTHPYYQVCQCQCRMGLKTKNQKKINKSVNIAVTDIDTDDFMGE